MNAFKHWLSGQIDELAFLSEREPDPQIAEHCVGVVEEVSNRAAALGFAELFKHGQAMTGTIGTRSARAYLAECLATIGAAKPADEASSMLTAKDLAKMLGINLRSVWRRKADGTLPQPVQLGRSVRWVRKEVERWLASN